MSISKSKTVKTTEKAKLAKVHADMAAWNNNHHRKIPLARVMFLERRTKYELETP